GDTFIVEPILSCGTDIETRTDDGVIAMYIAAGWGFAKLLHLVIAKGAEFNIKTTR
ncbi:hypothetical protein AOQ84DRAFT_280706, partial [Glonium stellatum]